MEELFHGEKERINITAADNAELILGVDYISIKRIGLFSCIKFIEFQVLIFLTHIDFFWLHVP